MYENILKIEKPQDLRNLNEEDLKKLCSDLRSEIIKTVSVNGGHLASNLGVVELTVSLLRKFDFSEDRIVWDVGHQTYAYKILTGRYPSFCTLRKMDGMAGFPKRCESIYDSFNTGHSSTSISAALGMLRANMLTGRQGKVVAVIGDGALTGGMAFEALNDAGQSNTDLIVILNDNQMSINSNVGGMAKHLESIRISSRYLKLKNKTNKILYKTKIGILIFRLLETIKFGFKRLIRPQKVIFEDLGFKYYGPIDGHDIKEIEKHLDAAKKIKGPILIHILTHKGKGYEFAEISPDKFHGIAPFEVSNGILKSMSDENYIHKKTFSEAFGSILLEFANKDSKITAICAAMVSGTGLDEFEKKYPERLFDVGIAEQHALTMAAGMACEGLRPVVAIYSTFLQRAYDQLLHDIALQGLHVVICIDRAGIVGEDGETHQGIYDLSLLMTIPEIVVLSPRNYTVLSMMMEYALYKCTGPVAIRYPRGKEKLFNKENVNHITKTENIIPEKLLSGNDITIVAEGSMVETGYNVCLDLIKEGFSCDFFDIRMIKPFYEKDILESVDKTKKILIMENALVASGIGSMIESLISEKNIQARVVKIGVKDHILKHGTVDELFKLEGMDKDSVYKKIKKILL